MDKEEGTQLLDYSLNVNMILQEEKRKYQLLASVVRKPLAKGLLAIFSCVI